MQRDALRERAGLWNAPPTPKRGAAACSDDRPGKARRLSGDQGEQPTAPRSVRWGCPEEVCPEAMRHEEMRHAEGAHEDEVMQMEDEGVLPDTESGMQVDWDSERVVQHREQCRDAFAATWCASCGLRYEQLEARCDTTAEEPYCRYCVWSAGRLICRGCCRGGAGHPD